MRSLRICRRTAIVHASMLLALPGYAQNFPSRPIRILVGLGAGGTADSIARLYGQKMSEVLGTPVIVDNRPGANQLTAIRALMAAPTDGYTLYAATASALVQNPAMRKGLGYDPLKDFTLIGMATTNPGVIFVSNALPVHNIGELVGYARAHPGKLNYGSAGLGTTGHLAGEALMRATGMQMTHIPYKADADVIREVMAGTLQLGIMPTLNSVQAVKAGKIRAISVTTVHRLPFLPDVPGLSEAAGLGDLATLDPHTFITIVGPAGLPGAVVSRLNDAINKVSAMPEVVSRVRDGFYAEPATSTPESFRTFVEKQLVVWQELGKVVKVLE